MSSMELWSFDNSPQWIYEALSWEFVGESVESWSMESPPWSCEALNWKIFSEAVRLWLLLIPQWSCKALATAKPSVKLWSLKNWTVLSSWLLFRPHWSRGTFSWKVLSENAMHWHFESQQETCEALTKKTPKKSWGALKPLTLWRFCI